MSMKVKVLYLVLKCNNYKEFKGYSWDMILSVELKIEPSQHRLIFELSWTESPFSRGLLDTCEHHPFLLSSSRVRWKTICQKIDQKKHIVVPLVQPPVAQTFEKLSPQKNNNQQQERQSDKSDIIRSIDCPAEDFCHPIYT